MFRRLTVLAVLTAASGAALSAPAYAADHVICVGSPVGTCNQHVSSIQDAITAAGNNGLTNTILVGPGTYSDGPYDLDGSAHKITLRGSGEGATTLTAAANAGGQTYVVAHGSAVQYLTIAMTAVDSSSDTGLYLADSSADHVAVRAAAGSTNVVGIWTNTLASVSHATVDLPSDVTQENLGVFSVGSTTLTDSTVVADIGIDHSDAARDRISRVAIKATHVGISSQFGPVDVDDSLIDLGTSAGAKGLDVENLNDSTDSKTITANHVTIVGGGAGSYGVYAYAARATALQQATVILGNSIVRGPTTDLYAVAGNNGAQGGNSVATIATLYSDWHSKAAVSQPHGTASIAVGEGHLDVAPGFRNPAASNYRLVTGSPVIDKGMPGTSALTLDLDRHARVQDGNRDGAAIRDMGAYEAAPDTTAPNTSLTSHPKKRTTKRRVTFGFASNEALVSFQCKVDAKPWRSCTSPKRYRVTRGWHRFKVRAVDASHNVDPTPAKFRFHRA